MNKQDYQPVFGDYETQAEHFRIFNVDNYDELLLLLSDKKINNQEEYLKLCNMYTTMVSGNMIPTLEGYDPEIKKSFFEPPQDSVVKEIYEKSLYRNDDYLTKISNFDYTKIDELTIDHIGFLFLEDWNDKYNKMNDIIGKLSDHIVILQSYFPDQISQEKIVRSYVVHLMTFMPKCLSGLSLGQLERYSEEEYLELNENVEKYQLKSNDIISHILRNDMVVEQIDEENKIKILMELETYQRLMIRKYSEIIAYAVNGGVIMINELPDLLMSMIQNDYVMDILRS